MTAPIPDDGLEVAKSALKIRAKAQLRVVLASIAGMLIGKHILPAGLLDDTMLDAITAILFAGIAAYWQDARAALQHSRLWRLAMDQRVPNEVIRPLPFAGIASAIVPGVAPARLGLRVIAGVVGLLLVGLVLWWVFVHPGEQRRAVAQAKVEGHLADAGATAATAAIAEQVIHDREITTIREITKEGENAVHSAAGADMRAPAVAAALGAALCGMRTYAAEPDCAALQADHRGVGPAIPNPGSFTPSR